MNLALSVGHLLQSGFRDSLQWRMREEVLTQQKDLCDSFMYSSCASQQCLRQALNSKGRKHTLRAVRTESWPPSNPSSIYP